MARAAKEKRRDVSVRSRAARRETIASGDVDLSLTAEDSKDKKSKSYVPFKRDYGGVTKKKKGKQLSRQQRIRQERGMERASQNLDKLSKKVADSHFREKKTKTRRAPWDELNEKVADKSDLLPKRPDLPNPDNDWEEVEMDADDDDDAEAEPLVAGVPELETDVVEHQLSAPDVDEIL